MGMQWDLEAGQWIEVPDPAQTQATTWQNMLSSDASSYGQIPTWDAELGQWLGATGLDPRSNPQAMFQFLADNGFITGDPRDGRTRDLLLSKGINPEFADAVQQYATYQKENQAQLSGDTGGFLNSSGFSDWMEQDVIPFALSAAALYGGASMMGPAAGAGGAEGAAWGSGLAGSQDLAAMENAVGVNAGTFGGAESFLGPATGTIQMPGTQTSGAITSPISAPVTNAALGAAPLASLAEGGGLASIMDSASAGGTAAMTGTNVMDLSFLDDLDFSSINTGIEGLGGQIGDLGDVFGDSLGNLGDVFNQGIEGLGGQVGGLGDIFNSGLSGLGSIFNSGMSGLGNLFTQQNQGIQSGLQSLLTGINKIPLSNLIGAGMGAYSSKQQMDTLKEMQQKAIDSDLWRGQQPKYFQPAFDAATKGIGNTPYGQSIASDTARKMSSMGYNMSGNQMHEIAQGLNRGTTDYMRAIQPYATGRAPSGDGSSYASGVAGAQGNMNQYLTAGLGSIFNPGQTPQQAASGQTGGATVGDASSFLKNIFSLT